MLDYLSQFPGPSSREAAIESIKREMWHIIENLSISSEKIHEVISNEIDELKPINGSHAARVSIFSPRIRRNVETKLKQLEIAHKTRVHSQSVVVVHPNNEQSIGLTQ